MNKREIPRAGRERPWTDKEERQLEELVRARYSVRAIAEMLDHSPASVRRRVERLRAKRAEQLSTGVFFVGLALLFVPGSPISFWPGILFVFGASAAARAFAEGRTTGNIQGAIWMFGLGAVFLWGFSWPLLLLLIGLSSILGFLLRPAPKPVEDDEGEFEKRKNDDLESLEKPKRDVRYAMRLGDDGELIEIAEDEADGSESRSARARQG